MSEQETQQDGKPGVLTQAAKPTVEQQNMMALQERLARYIETMAPGKPVDEELGGQMQMSLWSTIKFVLDKSGSEFVSLYSELLRIVHEHRKGVFSPRYVFRFAGSTRLNQNERRNFERMMNLIMATCDPSSRMIALRQINMHTTLSGFAHEPKKQQRIAGFYSI